MQRERTRYWVAFVEAPPKAPELDAALGGARRERARHHVLCTLMSFTLYAAFVGTAVFTFFYIGEYAHLEMTEFAEVGARAFVYFLACGLLMVAISHWIYLRRKFGAKNSHSSILWLRRFHRADGEHGFFKKAFARATPLTFAVTLRDSKLTGNLEEGLRRGTPALLITVLLIFGGVVLWESLHAACLAADHRCRALDRIWIFDSAIEREDTAFYDEVRAFTVVVALSLTLIGALALISTLALIVAPRFGFVRRPGAEATRAWFDALLSEGSSNVTYVLRTADEHWRSIVEHLYRGSGLVAFDLTHPTRHLEFELSLLHRHPVEGAMFIYRTTTAGTETDEQSFREFLTQRLPPELMAKLVFALLDKPSLSEEIRRQAEARLGPIISA